MELGALSQAGAAALAQRSALGAVGELAGSASAIVDSLAPDAMAAAGATRFFHQSATVAVDRTAALGIEGAARAAERLAGVRDAAGEAAEYAAVASDRSSNLLLSRVRSDSETLGRAFVAIDETARAGSSPGTTTDPAISAVKVIEPSHLFEEQLAAPLSRALAGMQRRLDLAGRLAAGVERLDGALVGSAMLAERRAAAAALADGSPFGAALAARESIDGAVTLALHAEREALGVVGAGVSAHLDGYAVQHIPVEAAASREALVLEHARSLLEDAARHAADAGAAGLRLEAERVAGIVGSRASEADVVRGIQVERLLGGVDEGRATAVVGRQDLAGWLGAKVGADGMVVPPDSVVTTTRSGVLRRASHAVDAEAAMRQARAPMHRELEALRELAERSISDGTRRPTAEARQAAEVIDAVTARRGTVEELRRALAAVTDAKG